MTVLLNPFSVGVVPPPDMGDAITMPIGLRNYGASTVAAGAVVQFGVPIDPTRGLSLSELEVTLTRDSDSLSIPVQLDLASTTRVGGDLCYAVATAVTPFSVSSTTTTDCTLTMLPGGTYSAGVEPCDETDLEGWDFKLEATGDDISGTGTASFNDYVYRRKIKSGAVVAWEGWSRVKVAGVAQGQWCVRWEAETATNADLAAWRIKVRVFCVAVDGTPFASAPYGKIGTFVLKAGTATLNNDADFVDVFVSAVTGFQMYGANSRHAAWGDTTLRPVHDRDYLIAEKAIPPYRWVGDASSNGDGAPGSFDDDYTPGGIGGFRAAWGGGGVDGTIGPIAAVSYNMLASPDDDDAWRRGWDAGLCQLSVAMHLIDPATGYFRPKFGTYSGLGTANTARVKMLTTYNSDGSSKMEAEHGHWCQTAYVPALLTGERVFLDGLHAGLARVAQRHADYNRPQVTGRTRREFPFLYQWDESYLTRYDDWPHGDLLHFLYIADDAHPEKAYAEAIEAETAAWGTDLFADFLPWTSTGATTATSTLDAIAFDGVSDGSSTTNAWALGLCQFSDVNAYGVTTTWRADAPWCMDFRAHIMWYAAVRNGETYPAAIYSAFFSRYMIGRALGTDMCVAYSSEFNPPSMRPTNQITQTWEDYWQRFFNSTATPGTRTTCPSTATPDAGKIAHKYRSAMRLLDGAGFDGAYGETYATALAAIDACFGGGDPNWDEWSDGGRWLVEEA